MRHGRAVIGMMDNIHIYVLPTELWDYVQQNRDLIRDNIVVIAEDSDNHTEIVVRFDEGACATVSTYKGDVLIRDDQIISREDATYTCRAVYERFLTPYGKKPEIVSPLPAEDEDDEDDEEEDATGENEQESPDEDDLIQDEIDKRETELEDSLMDFLEVAIEEQVDLVSVNELDEILDEVLILLTSFGYSVYRPTPVGDEVIDYPYESDSDSEN